MLLSLFSVLPLLPYETFPTGLIACPHTYFNSPSHVEKNLESHSLSPLIISIMKSFATLFGGSKKKERDKLKAKLAPHVDGDLYPPRLAPPDSLYLRAGSPVSTFSTSDHSLRSKRSMFATFTDGRVQQRETHRPSLTQSFFRSVTDVSKPASLSPTKSIAVLLFPDSSDVSLETFPKSPVPD